MFDPLQDPATIPALLLAAVLLPAAFFVARMAPPPRTLARICLAAMAVAAIGIALPVAFYAFSRLRAHYVLLGGAAAAATAIGLLWPRAAGTAGVVPDTAVRFAGGLVGRSVRAAALPVAALAVVFGFGSLVRTLANHDLAWLLYVGGRMLDGARPYRDLVEVNPPLVLYLSTGAAFIARLLGASAILTFQALTLAVVLGSIAMCGWILRRLPWTVTGWIVAALAFLLVAFPGVEFGQREHLLLALYLPYLALAACRSAGRPAARTLAIGVAIAAAIGLSLKPYFVLAWLTTELYVVLRVGRRAALRRPEPWVVAAVGLLYLTAVTLFLPRYWTLVSWASGLYRQYSAAPLAEIALNARAALSLLALLVAFAWSGSRDLREFRRLVALSGCALFVALLWQGKGWDYHWYPVLATALLSLGLTALDLCAAWGLTNLGALAMSASCALSPIARALDYTRRGDADRYPYQLSALVPLVRHYAVNRRVLVLSTQVGAAFPLVNYSGVTWASRFNCLWFVPGLYAAHPTGSTGRFRYHVLPGMPVTEQRILAAYGTDLSRMRPSLLIVDTDPQGGSLAGFEILPFLQRDPVFAAELRQYRVVATVRPFLLLARESAAAAANHPATPSQQSAGGRAHLSVSSSPYVLGPPGGR